MKSIITIVNDELKQFFFTDNHCQEHKLGDDWVPVTCYLPMSIVPRECVPDGRIWNKEQLQAVFYDDYEEIPNPDILISDSLPQDDYNYNPDIQRTLPWMNEY